MGYMNNDGLLYFWSRLKSIFVRTVNGTAPDANGNVAVAVPAASDTSPKMDGTATVGTETAFARGDHIHPKDTSKANLASPTFTGTPKAPTASAGTNTTQIATTAFVQTAVGGKQDTLTFDDVPTANSDNPVKSGGIYTALQTVSGEIPSAYTSNPAANGTASPGSSSNYSRGDHVHPTDTTRAPVASPALTGTPTAPTAMAGTNTTQIATTAFVQAAVASAVSGVAAFQGAVASASQINALSEIKMGWYWVVQTAGTYFGENCEVGDFIYVTDPNPTREQVGVSTYVWDDADFSMIQANVTPMTNSDIDSILAQ